MIPAIWERTLLGARPWWVHLANILPRLGTQSLPTGRGEQARAQQRGAEECVRLSSFRANPLLRPLGEGGGLRLADGRYIMSSHRSVGVIVGDFWVWETG